VWNKDMTVDPTAIRVVLDDSSDAKAKGADPKKFYDNTLIQRGQPRLCVEAFSGGSEVGDKEVKGKG
jgi:hypothetical protein